MENKFELKRKQESRIFAGLILVVIGASLLLRNIGFPLPYWLFSWPVLLIIIGIYSGAKHGFRNNAWFIMVGIGAFFLVDKFIPGLTLQPYFWPIVIIVVGIIFIIRPHKSYKFDYRNNKLTDEPGTSESTGFNQSIFSKVDTDSSDFLKVTSVFSGVNKNVVSKNFQGGKISCVFGGADIDLTKAEIFGRTELYLEVVFGGVKLVTPPHWTVLNEVDGVFHGIDDKRKFTSSIDTSPEKVLVLRGSVVFGGVEIRSY